MSMRDLAEELREEFKELFNDKMTLKQIWWVIKMMKAARVYCRNSIVFDDFMNIALRGVAEFSQVPKQDTQEKGYTGLEIRMIKPDGTVSETEIVTDME